MQTVLQRATSRWSLRPQSGWLALIGVGMLASIAGAIFPSAPASDAWLPYQLRLRVSSPAGGRIALWWDRHAGYVTSAEAVQTLAPRSEFVDVRIPCPAGPLVRCLLQFSPREIRIQSVATIQRDETTAVVLSLRNAAPLHKTCDLAWENDTLVVRPRSTTNDAQLELLLRPALTLPSPHAELPAHLAAAVRRQRILGAMLAAVGIGLTALVGQFDGFRNAAWTLRPLLRGMVVTYATLAIAFARRPDIFGLPQFWAEDGSVFFAEQQQHGLAAMLKPYAGYLHLWPRLVATAAGGFPAMWSPTIYLAGAVVALSFCVWRAASPRAGPAIPGACALAVVLVPRMGELLLNVTNAQWFGAVALLLVAVARPPVSRGERVGDIATILLFGLTGPFSLLLLPLFFWRVWRDRDASACVALLLLGATASVQTMLVVQHSSATAAAVDVANTNSGFGSLLAAAGLRTGGEFLGLAGHIDGSAASWIGAAALAGWAGLWFVPGRSNAAATKLMFAWAAFAVLAGGLARYRSYPEELFLPTHAQRYFHLPILVTTWLLLAGTTRMTGWRRILCGALIALWGLQLTGTFRIAPMVDFQWREQIRAVRPNQAATIPINPAPWAVVLPAVSSDEREISEVAPMP